MQHHVQLPAGLASMPSTLVLLVQARLAASPWREAPTPRRLLLGTDGALQASDDEQAAVGMLTPDGSQPPAPGAQADPPGSLVGEVARLRLERGALQQALTALQVKCEALLAAMGPGTSCQALAKHCEGGGEDNTEPHDVQVSCADWLDATNGLSSVLHQIKGCLRLHRALAEHLKGGQHDLHPPCPAAAVQ